MEEKLSLLEIQVQKCFTQVLNETNIEIDDDFFSVGGDSLTANELMVLIEKHLRWTYP